MTGAGGFVGANLVRRLVADGHEVVGTARPGGDAWRLHGAAPDFELVSIDLTEPEAAVDLLRRSRPDWVFHLATYGAYSWQNDLPRIVTVNLQATAALLDAAARSDVSAFINAGSSSEYGFKDHPAAEDERVEPNSAYAVTKAAGTHYCRMVALREERPFSTLRLYSAYGPWEDPGRLVPRLIVTGLQGSLPPLVGPGTARDFVFVDDVCDAFVAAAADPGLSPGAVLNVASGRQVELRAIVELVREMLGVTETPRWGSTPARSWDTTIWVGDPRAARAALGWAATTTLRDGIARFVEWMTSEPGVRGRYEG